MIYFTLKPRCSIFLWNKKKIIVKNVLFTHFILSLACITSGMHKNMKNMQFWVRKSEIVFQYIFPTNQSISQTHLTGKVRKLKKIWSKHFPSYKYITSFPSPNSCCPLKNCTVLRTSVAICLYLFYFTKCLHFINKRFMLDEMILVNRY